MSKSRKTIDVETVRNDANYFLENTPPIYAERRKGVAALLEVILSNTGNFKGFRYLDSDWSNELISGDETRRYYY